MLTAPYCFTAQKYYQYMSFYNVHFHATGASSNPVNVEPFNWLSFLYMYIMFGLFFSAVFRREILAITVQIITPYPLNKYSRAGALLAWCIAFPIIILIQLVIWLRRK